MTKGSCKLNLPRGSAQRIFKDKRKKTLYAFELENTNFPFVIVRNL